MDEILSQPTGGARGIPDISSFDPVNVDALPTIPSITPGSRARDQSGIKIGRVFQHIGYCIFFRAPEGFHNVAFWTAPYENVVRTVRNYPVTGMRLHRRGKYNISRIN